ncbi:MAG: hypothetical protein E7035_06355 [Verrucomicrobiaceae bacterium]|nr:hypothetical protein [Verrucomicrobiaceae bacterium]
MKDKNCENDKKENKAFVFINKFSEFLLTKFFWGWDILKPKIPEKYSSKVDEKIEKFKTWDIQKQKYTALGVFSVLVVFGYILFSGDDSYSEPTVVKEQPTIEQLEAKIEKEQSEQKIAKWNRILEDFKALPLSTQIKRAESTIDKSAGLGVKNAEEQIINIVKSSINETKNPKDLMDLSKRILTSEHFRNKYNIPVEESAVFFVQAVKNDTVGQFLDKPLPVVKIETAPGVGRKANAPDQTKEIFTEDQIKDLALLGHVEASEKYGHILMSKNPTEAADFYLQRIKAGETKYLDKLIELTNVPSVKKYFAENMESPEVKKIIESGHRNGSIILLNCELDKGDQLAYIKYASNILLVSSEKNVAFVDLNASGDAKNITNYMKGNRAKVPDEYHTKTMDVLLDMAINGNDDALKILDQYFQYVLFPVYIFYEDIEKFALLNLYKAVTNKNGKNASENYNKLIKSLLSKEKLFSEKEYSNIKDNNKKLELIYNIEALNYVPSEKYISRYMNIINKYKDSTENDERIYINNIIYNSSFVPQKDKDIARDFIINTYCKYDFAFNYFSQNYEIFFKLRGNSGLGALMNAMSGESYQRYIPVVNDPGIVNILNSAVKKFKTMSFVEFATKEKTSFEKKEQEGNMQSLYALILVESDKNKAKEYFLKLINNTNDIAALDTALYLSGKKSLGWMFNEIYSDLRDGKYTPKTEIERDLLEYTCALNFAYAKTTESIKRLEFKDKKLSEADFNKKISSSYERLLIRFGGKIAFSESIEIFKDLYKGKFLERIVEYQINNFFYSLLHASTIFGDIKEEDKKKMFTDFFASLNEYNSSYYYFDVAIKFHKLGVLIQKNKGSMEFLIALPGLGGDAKSLDDVSIVLAKKALEKADGQLKEAIQKFLEEIN